MELKWYLLAACPTERDDTIIAYLPVFYILFGGFFAGSPRLWYTQEKPPGGYILCV